MEAQSGLDGIDETDLQFRMGELVPLVSLKDWLKNALTNKATSEKVVLTAANISMKLIQEITRMQVAKITRQNGNGNGNGLGKRRPGVVNSNLAPPPIVQPAPPTHSSEFSFPPLLPTPTPAPSPSLAPSPSPSPTLSPAPSLSPAPILPPNRPVRKFVEPSQSSEPS